MQGRGASRIFFDHLQPFFMKKKGWWIARAIDLFFLNRRRNAGTTKSLGRNPHLITMKDLANIFRGEGGKREELMNTNSI